MLVCKHSEEPMFVTDTTQEAVPHWRFGSDGSGIRVFRRVNSCVMLKRKSGVKKNALGSQIFLNGHTRGNS